MATEENAVIAAPQGGLAIGSSGSSRALLVGEG